VLNSQARLGREATGAEAREIQNALLDLTHLPDTRQRLDAEHDIERRELEIAQQQRVRFENCAAAVQHLDRAAGLLRIAENLRRP
jgi:hypothetical protein